VSVLPVESNIKITVSRKWRFQNSAESKFSAKYGRFPAAGWASAEASSDPAALDAYGVEADISQPTSLLKPSKMTRSGHSTPTSHLTSSPAGGPSYLGHVVIILHVV
jgi:hypothetical protein